MPPDIVKQLRNRKEHRYDGPTQDYGWYDDELCHEAADTITTLRAKLEKAREALKWYAATVGNCRKLHSDGDQARQALDRDCGKRATDAIKELDT